MKMEKVRLFIFIKKSISNVYINCNLVNAQYLVLGGSEIQNSQSDEDRANQENMRIEVNCLYYSDRSLS
jgi:hypothetical protein